MRKSSLFLLAVSSLLVVGCSCSPDEDRPKGGSVASTADPDGVACSSDSSGMGAVFIEIVYASDGTPSSVPDQCHVSQGTPIVFRTVAGEMRGFVIDFPTASPGRHLRGPQPSGPRGGRQKLDIVADGPLGTYKYDIEANGHIVDPDIIIDRIR